MANPSPLLNKFRTAFCGTDDLKALRTLARNAPKRCTILVFSDGRRLGKANLSLIRARFRLISVAVEFDLRTLEFTGRVVQKWASRKSADEEPLSNLFCRSDCDLHVQANSKLPVVVATNL